MSLIPRPLLAFPVVVVMVATTACSRDSTLDEAQALHQEITGAADDSPACRLFSAKEIAAALGGAVEEGSTSGPLGSGCSWPIKGEDRSVMVQIVPRDYWEDGARQPGGEVLADIGEKAFVGPWLDDIRAGALTSNGAVYVMSPNRDASIALLRSAAPRVPAQ